MSRTTKYKLAYISALLALLILVGVIVILLGASFWVLFTCGLVLLVPGRIQGIYYRDLFTGRRLLDEGKPDQAIPFIERFLSSIAQHPQRSKLLWLSGVIYTPSVVAMAKNNLGVARLELGLTEEAERAFTSALDEDSMYPVPYFNMAIIQEMRGNRPEAEQALERARQLGFGGGTLDSIIRKSQQLLSRMQGKPPIL